MSKMTLRSNGRPPLARSPIRLRPRRPVLQPTANNKINSPPGSLTKSQMPTRKMDIDKSEIRPGYHTISCELRALAKMVNQEIGKGDEKTIDGDIFGVERSPLFERGRFYNEYSARRNERLKRKKGEMEGYEKKTGYDLGVVRVDSTKKREVRKFDSGRKVGAVAAASTPVAERREARTPRYSLRSSTSSKENKKPPPLTTAMPMMSVERSVGVTERKVRARTTWKK